VIQKVIVLLQIQSLILCYIMNLIQEFIEYELETPIYIVYQEPIAFLDNFPRGHYQLKMHIKNYKKYIMNRALIMICFLNLLPLRLSQSVFYIYKVVI